MGRVMALGLLVAALLVVALSMSPAHAAVSAGDVYAWGANAYGKLGIGQTGARNTPVAVSNIMGVKSVKAGCDHALALKEDGSVWAWGYNSAGQLGNDSSGPGTDSSVPVTVTGLSNVRSISGGAYNSMAGLESGRARSWGDNRLGQLGTGTTGPDSDVPVAVKNLTNVTNIDGGYEFALAATR
jgi:alpha-tubulin suppressor-like RCC1 family protein